MRSDLFFDLDAIYTRILEAAPISAEFCKTNSSCQRAVNCQLSEKKTRTFLTTKRTSKVTSVTGSFRSKPLPRLSVTLASKISPAATRDGTVLPNVADMLLNFG